MRIISFREARERFPWIRELVEADEVYVYEAEPGELQELLESTLFEEHYSWDYGVMRKRDRVHLVRSGKIERDVVEDKNYRTGSGSGERTERNVALTVREQLGDLRDVEYVVREEWEYKNNPGQFEDIQYFYVYKVQGA